MKGGESVAGVPSEDPVDRLIIQLRAYVHGRPKSDWRPEHDWTSGLSLTFDTETTVDPSQRLRFGAYQVRSHGALLERGIFYAEDISASDLKVLRDTFAEFADTAEGEHLAVRTRAEFVEEVFYKWGFEVGGLIVGFNLPFDLSRLAVAHTYAKGAMKGGFSFTLAPGRPSVRVKHLSQRAAFIDFAGKDGDNKVTDRGFFVDVKTLAATLTSQSHSLKSLAKLLGTIPKGEIDSLDGPLTPDIVRYGVRDVQVTWECFAELARRYDKYQLKTGMHQLYSEASLGKALLSEMNVKPWRQVQPTFPPDITGQIMSTYYGGRAEVHIRREITPVIHCDFLSMYPTVCTLMALWQFVIAQGIDWADDTENVRRFIEDCSPDWLRRQETWRDLTCIVQIKPSGDILPVRAAYEADQPTTIGLNHLSSREPMWFTLADVLAAKVLGNRMPEIIAALRFSPKDPQKELRSITLEGSNLDPKTDDFYARLINQRREIQAQEGQSKLEDKLALKSAQQSLKILANSTSYGIFVEINVQALDDSTSFTCYDFRGVGRKVTSSKREDAGRYFHPLLGTLITGAARLMLALAEQNAIDQGLSWAFCDTDSLAIANVAGLPEEAFKQRVEAVRAWFEPLNPYEVKGSILQLEKVNYPAERPGEPNQLRPVSCLAISAKRYVLFDRDETSSPIVRKASAHGLGYLTAPYKESDKARADRIGNKGVELWQEDLWLRIIEAHDKGHPEQVDYASLTNFDQPAASRYAATNQTLLKWFETYNEAVPLERRVRPLNFLLSFQAKSRMEMGAVDSEALSSPQWRRRTPTPASRYSTDLIMDQPSVFDRRSGDAIAWAWLKSYGRALVRHHLSSERKFLGGEGSDHGALRRRHVEAWATIPIGKEADNLEEREFLSDGDEEIRWAMADQDRHLIAEEIAELMQTSGISANLLVGRARVSHHTLRDLQEGKRLSAASLLRLAQAAEELRREVESVKDDDDLARRVGSELAERLGSVSALAIQLGMTRQYVGRVLKGQKRMTPELKSQLLSWRL